MEKTIKRVQYFYVTVHNRPGEAYKLLSILTESGVNLFAFSAVPMGTDHTQLVLFPESPGELTHTARLAGIEMLGPHHAFLVQGDDHLGALTEIHRDLQAASINVFSSTGVADGRGGFGYVLYVGADDFEKAAETLDV